MGYFSNGSENEYYVDQYCSRCIHADTENGCAVMHLHWLWNYDQHGESDTEKAKKQALEILIPRRSDGFNDQCKMFVKIERTT